MKRTGFSRPDRAELLRKFRERDERRRVKLAERRRSGRDDMRVRVGTLPPLPKDWLFICTTVIHRDGFRCRYCGVAVRIGSAQIDHIVPRRLAKRLWRDHLRNLATLCPAHHGEKTAGVEAGLLVGKPYLFYRWLDVMERTGSVPSPQEVEAALGRLNRLLESERERGDGRQDCD